MFNFGYPFQFNFNPFMNFFMPFNQPMINFFNPFAMPNFNIFTPMNYYNPYSSYPNQSIFSSNISRTTRVSTPVRTSSSASTRTVERTSKQDKPYNKVKGEKLAQKVVANLPSDRDPEHPLCAKYVKEAVEDCGLGEYIKGNGAHCKYVFRANPNFKEVKFKDFSNLPTGTIVVYQANDKVTFKDGSTGTVGENGHVKIALEDGRACSDIIEDEIAYSSRANTFIPV